MWLVCISGASKWNQKHGVTGLTEGEKSEEQQKMPLWAKIIIGASIICIIVFIGYIFFQFNSAANDIKTNRGHTNIVYAYQPSGDEATLSLEAVCIEPLHDIIGGQVSYHDFSAPILYVVEGGCVDNEVIQTIVWKNSTTTVSIIDLDQALKSNTMISG